MDSTSKTRPFDISRMRRALAQRALHHASQHDHAAVGVEPRVEDESL